MLHFIYYQTPKKFYQEFDLFYSYVNLNQVKIIGNIVAIISAFIICLSLVFQQSTSELNFYSNLSKVLWVFLIGGIVFSGLSTYALKKQNISPKIRKLITVLFIGFFLTISLAISFVLASNGAKNMITVYLVGISTVSLFFALEYKVLLGLTLYITTAFVCTMVIPNIPFNQKILNILAASVLSTVLIAFSRYSYYFKSIHFMRVKELEDKNKEIQHLSSQKGEILAFVAHDLRAPLNNIEALSSLILMENENCDEAKMIVSSAAQAKNIINDLIEAAKQDHNQKFPTQPIGLNAFVKQISVKWEANTERKIRLILDEEEIFVNANSSKLERVIDNLISNAFKFSSIYKPIDITVSNNKHLAFIKIVDFGIGIPQHLQAHVFDQFSKAGREGLMGEKSVGLGLHISHKIIEQHQGELIVESKENEGTTFIIELPIKNN